MNDQERQALAIEESAKMRVRSGDVTSSDLLVSFLYLLMRDHLTPGEIENIMLQVPGERTPSDFSNGWLARYAQDVARRLGVKG